MCSALKELICFDVFRCTKCKNPTGDSNERCSDSPNSSPKIRRVRRIKRKSNSYELFSSEMESNRTGEIDCKISIEERTLIMKTKTNCSFNPAERNGDDGTPRRQSRQSSQTPEYVKRTAKLFETVKVTRDEVENCKNGIGGGGEGGGGGAGVGKKSDGVDSSSQLMTEIKQIERETVKISLDSLDGDYGKKPSYLGVSCSNSGYRNVINYDSKLREGFWKGNSQRESLVLCSSRMRESSPLRRDYEFKSLNGGEGNVTRSVRVEKEMTTTTTTGSPSANGISHSHPEKFVNISTSTKTISTFRNSKDMKGAETERSVNGIENGEATTNAETKVNLKQILNGKSDEPYRKGYSNLGFSPKILKSPEKNCNSFLKSINSFENNWKKSQRTRSSTYPRPESTASDSNNSIQQRIERLYGPGALAQGFYTGQKPNSKTPADKPEELPSDGVVEPVPQSAQPQTPVLTKTNLETNNLAKTKPLDVAPPEQCSNGHVVEETEVDDDDAEKNGTYFLKLLKKETDRLERLASFAESELENGENLPEEISGKLRSAAGKARLLVCQKLKQFEGLCQKNLSEKPSEPFRTTNEDLAGFWDMVMLQVVQVYGVFDELEQLKKNNWKSTPTKKVTSTTPTTNGQSQSGKTTPKKSTPNSASSAKSEEAKKAREETRRKLLEERRKKMKELKENKIISKETEVEIFAK